MTTKIDTPKVGMAATIRYWSDRYPATIVAIKGKNNRMIGVREDIAVRTDKNGVSKSQTYDYAYNDDAPIRWFSMRCHGTYAEVGSKGGPYLNVGYREKYWDPSF